MDKKITGIVAYITWVGLIIAYFAGDKEGAKFHINQALTIWLGFLASIILGNILGKIPLIGGVFSVVFTIVNIALLLCLILGIIYAVREEEKEVPIIGMFKLLK